MKQLKLALTFFVSISFLSSTTFADSLFKGEPMPISSVYNWTGFYAGLNAGAVKHTMDITDNQAIAFNSTLQQTTNPKFTGGFQLGYRRQLDLSKASGVYGIEFSANLSNAKFNKIYGSSFALYQLSSENQLKNLCLLQALGGIAADRTLLFIAAGLSWTNITGNTTNMDSAPFFGSFSVNQKALGSALSGGLEYAFTQKISARFKVDIITPSVYTTSDGTGDNFLIANSIVQGTFGVNYKFA